MESKKPYTKPAIFAVELDSQQAVLTACSLVAGSPSSGATGGCRGGMFFPCKGSFFMFGTDSSGRPS